MTGLLDTFRRHFAVLLRNLHQDPVSEVSRCSRRRQGAPAPGGRGAATGPEGWSPDVPGPCSRRGRPPAASGPPYPCRVGPVPCGHCPARVGSARAVGWLGRYRYYPPGIPTRLYPPCTIPRPARQPATTTCTARPPSRAPTDMHI